MRIVARSYFGNPLRARPIAKMTSDRQTIRPTSRSRPDPASAQRNRALRHEVVCLINRVRQRHGLGHLRANRKLRRAAQGHSVQMVRRDYFAHGGSGGPGRRIARTGYFAGARRWRRGEILAEGTGGLSSPAAIVRAWLHSPEHRGIMLDPGYRDFGAGIVHGAPKRGDQGATFTVDFGARTQG